MGGRPISGTGLEPADKFVLLQNSLLQFLTSTLGVEYLHTQVSKIALATVPASLSLRGTRSASFMKAYVINKTHLCPAMLMAPGRSRLACTLMFDMDGASYGIRDSLPNNPGCANFASILRTVLFGAISMHNYYVSTVEFARVIRVCNFFQFRRMRERVCQICAENEKKFVCEKKSEPRFKPGISN